MRGFSAKSQSDRGIPVDVEKTLEFPKTKSASWRGEKEETLRASWRICREFFRERITQGIYFTEITVLECARDARVKFEINSIPGFCGNRMVVEVRVQ